MTSKDPRIRMALKLQRILQKLQSAFDPSVIASVEGTLHQSQQLSDQFSLYMKCRKRGWAAASDTVYQRMLQILQRIKHISTTSLQPIPASLASRCLSARDLCAELGQLADEFPQTSLDLKKQVISAQTEAIVLEDIYLGEFRLELHLDRLLSHCDAKAFDIVALDPHPASGDADIVHPHVRDNQICAGDGAAPIASALREGRIADAFLAIHAVIRTYNSSSPYISLDRWQGIVCSDCGNSEDDDNSFFCDGCSSYFCRECFSSCDLCNEAYCNSCLEQDDESDRNCCPSCRHQCEFCGRTVDARHFNESTQLCPGCEAARQELNEMTVISHPNSTTQETNEQPVTAQSPSGIDPGQAEQTAGSEAVAASVGTSGGSVLG